MKIKLEQADHHTKFDHLFKVISGKKFLNKEGIGNEIPFFVAPFDPAEANEIYARKDQLIQRLKQNGVQVLEINLYDLTLDILKERNLFDRILSSETNYSKDQLKELFQGVLDAEKHLIPRILDRIKEHEFQVLFLTGIGEVYPYIRTHNLLHNFKNEAHLKPVVIFFPGEYNYSVEDGASLNLFCGLRDGYYRGFNIFNYEA